MVLVLYGSVTGNAIDLTDVLVDHILRRKLPVKVMEFGKCTLAEIEKEEYVFVICATVGQGELPENTRPLWKNMLFRNIPVDIFANVNVFIFGLGSKAYTKFNFAARKIQARMLQLGANMPIPRGEGDDIGSVPYEQVFDEWCSACLSILDSNLQIIDLLPETQLLPPVRTKCDDFSGIKATVTLNKRLTPIDHFQDVRLIRLKLENQNWQPGDVLSILPNNELKTVEEVFESQNWPLNLEVARHLDFNAVPRRKFFMVCQHFCKNEKQAERMREFANDLDDLFNYTSRPRRSVAEVMLEFDSLFADFQYINDIIPFMRPRKYSISNIQGDEIELVVAIVKYRTIIRRIRQGTASRYLEGLAVGDKVDVKLENNNTNILAKSSNRQVILVATGTGIAPIRALLQSLPEEGRENRILFYGCRGEKEDFLFADELNSKAVVIPAFSRHGGGYVQQQIEQYNGQFNKNAFIYVCGSSGAMPRAVRAAFIGKIGTLEIEEKDKNGLYIEETW